MENNGKHSITKRTKNIQMRYFFIKDHIENGDLSLKYCLTGKMYTDFFTKALWGSMFQQLLAMIQGTPKSTPDIYMICYISMAKVTAQEYVGQNDRYTHRTATARTNAHGGTYTDACGSLWTEKHTKRSTRKYALQKHMQVWLQKHMHRHFWWYYGRF